MHTCLDILVVTQLGGESEGVENKKGDELGIQLTSQPVRTEFLFNMLIL